MECSQNFKILFISAILFTIIIVISQKLLNKYEPFVSSESETNNLEDSPASKA